MVPVDAQTVKAVYAMLLKFPPFSKWNMPSPEKVNFTVAPLKSMWGDYSPTSRTIRVSTVTVTTYLSLLTTVAHETIHLKQDISDRWPAKDAHNAHFKKMAAQVCKHFPFMDVGNM